MTPTPVPPTAMVVTATGEQRKVEVGNAVARGGSEQIRYFLHGEWENELGVPKVPEFEKAYVASHALSLSDRRSH